MRSQSSGRNLRIIIAAATVTWVVCMCLALGAGFWYIRYGGGTDLSAATGSPQIGTQIELSPSEGYSGTELTVSGQNWRPGDVIFIRMQNEAGQTDESYAYAGVVADSAGRFSTSFVYPYDPSWSTGNSVQVVARAEASGMQAAATFRLVAPTVAPTPTQDPTIPTATAVPVVPTPQPGLPTLTPTPGPPPPREPAITEWRGAYYTNPNLQGQPAMIRNDREVNFEWGTGGPAPGLPTDNFSVRWTRNLNFEGGNYRFTVRVDDGVRLWIDDQIVIDQWHDSGPVTYVAERYLTPGGHNIRMDYFERVGWSVAQLGWARLQESYPDWKGEYFGNANLSGSPVLVRNDPWIDFNWGAGSPGSNVPSDEFSVRWTRTWRFDAGDYRFYVKVDDGARLWIDDQLVIDQWHDSGPVTYTADRRLESGDHRLRLEYYERVGTSQVHLWWERVEVSYPDWKGEYYSNSSLSGSPVVTRNDARPDFNWGEGSPAAGIPSNNFSARWTRNQQFDHSGHYRFYATVDDGVRVWVSGDPVIDEWRNGSARTVSGTKWIDSGEKYVKVEYYDDSGNARITVWWEREEATSTPTKTSTPTETSQPTATTTGTSVPTSAPTSAPTGTVVPTLTEVPVEPSVALFPSEGSVGTPVLVKGSGWPAGESVALTFARSEPGMTKVGIDPTMTAATVTAESDGSFEATVALPEGQGWEDQQQALVVAYTSDFSTTAVTPFSITVGPAPTDTVAPTGEVTVAPTEAATEMPTGIPEPTSEPAETPTEVVEPTTEPTIVIEPTAEPTQEVVEPTEMPAPPTEEPPQPTEAPVETPTQELPPSQPIISLVPVSGTVGITLTVLGEGWPVGVPVEFSLARTTGEDTPPFTMPLTDTVQVNEEGAFNRFIWLPAGVGWEDAPQTLVIARVAEGQIEVVAPYTVVTPNVEAPPPNP